MSIQKESPIGKEHQFRSLPEQRRRGLEDIMTTASPLDLYKLVSKDFEGKEMCVSLYHIMAILHPEVQKSASGDYLGYGSRRKADKPTVEFRQHTSTLNFGEVEAWIKTLGRIILWLEERGVDIEVLLNLIPPPPNHTQLHGEENVIASGRDGEGEYSKMDGNVIEKEDFSVIELLESMGLRNKAKFYKAQVGLNSSKIYLGAEIPSRSLPAILVHLGFVIATRLSRLIAICSIRAFAAMCELIEASLLESTKVAEVGCK
jgi:hypothetical protein